MAVRSAYLAKKGDKPVKAKPDLKNSGLSAELELKAYHDMLLIRRFEEKAGQLYGMGAIGGFCHLYIGQEAVVVGLEMAAIEGDQRITSYRDHGHMLACGMDPKGVMAELTGKKGGYSHGKGGSMHMFSLEKQFYGGHGIVAAQVPLGAGLAFANKYRGNKNVSMAYFGDGAANQGQVYETFNMASIWKLPVDGMDVRAVKEAADRAMEHCRSGEGPYILEMMTYRYRGHSMSDPAKYRSKEEVQKMREEHDPIEQVKARLLKSNRATEDDLKKMDADIREIVTAAADFAVADVEPDASELYTDIYKVA